MLLMISVGVITMALIVGKRYHTLTREKPRPPMAPYGFLRMFNEATSASGPWFLLKISRSAIGTIFRMKFTPFGFGPDFVVVGDAKLAQSVLRNPKNLKPEWIFKSFDSYTRGPSMLTKEGHRWHHARSAINPAFSSKNVKTMNSIVLEQVNKWAQEDLIPKYIEKDSPFDISAVFLRQVLKGISVAAFEYEMSNEEVEAILHELKIMGKELPKHFRNPTRKFFGQFTPTGQRYALALDRNIELSKKILKHYRSLDDPKDGTIISMIVNNPNYKSDDERIAEITLFFFAGHDTTVYSLAWTFLELAKNPLEQTKLRNALRNAPKDKWTSLPELRCAVKEGTRLHPALAGGTWRVLSSDTRTDKYFLAKGTHVYINFLVVFRNQEYVDRPDEFIPSRWIDPSDDLSSAYFPFALGRRNCLGQALAIAELNNVLATLIAEYEFSVFEEGTVDYFLTLKPIGAKLIAKRVCL